MAWKTNNHGFSFVELMIVVIIIGILATITTYATTNLMYQSRGLRMVDDFKKIETAWKTWRVDTGGPYPLDSEFTSSTLQCGDDPITSSTDIFENVIPNTDWNGPYLIEDVLDPWDFLYSYDSDGDTYTPGDNSSITNGTNIVLSFCTGNNTQKFRYGKLASYIDEIIDNADGPNAGKFFYFVNYSSNSGTDRGWFMYKLSATN